MLRLVHIVPRDIYKLPCHACVGQRCLAAMQNVGAQDPLLPCLSNLEHQRGTLHHRLWPLTKTRSAAGDADAVLHPDVQLYLLNAASHC